MLLTVGAGLEMPYPHLAVQADEEMLLLEAIDMYGLGNWAAVAEHVGTKTGSDCQRHYHAIYIMSPVFPTPTPLREMAGVNPMEVLNNSIGSWRSKSSI